MDENTLEIQQVVYVDRFAGRVSTYFLVSFTYKYGKYGRHSTILLQNNLDFSHIS